MLNRILIAAALCSVPVQLSAAVVYSNYGAGFPADSPSFYTTGGTFFATNFTTTGAGSLSSLTVDMEGTTSPVTAALYTDSGGEPGTLLESWTAAVPIGSNFPPPPLTTLVSVLHPSLSAGTEYWFVLTEAPGQIAWFANDEAVDGGVWVGNSLTGLSQAFPGVATPGIQVISNAAVPEPATGMLLAAGAFMLIIGRRYGARRRAR